MDIVPLLAVVLRSGTALLLLEGAVGKFRDRAGFEGVVANYRLLPAGLVAPVAAALPAAEVLLAAGLFAPALARWAGLGSAALLLTFAVAMAVNLVRGRREIACGCGRSGSSQPISWPRVGRNVFLAAGLGASWWAANPPLAAWPLGLAGGLALFILDYAAHAVRHAAPGATGVRP